MSRFPAEWLALREPVDFASHNQGVLQACEKFFTERNSIQVCDLGTGTGASVRAFSAMLPKQQSWTLFDHDQENLCAALDTLSSWGEPSSATQTDLSLHKNGYHLDVHVQTCDLVLTPSPWSDKIDLITASALFDLVSERWIARLLRR